MNNVPFDGQLFICCVYTWYTREYFTIIYGSNGEEKFHVLWGIVPAFHSSTPRVENFVRTVSRFFHYLHLERNRRVLPIPDVLAITPLRSVINDTDFDTWIQFFGLQHMDKLGNHLLSTLNTDVQEKSLLETYPKAWIQVSKSVLLITGLDPLDACSGWVSPRRPNPRGKRHAR